MLTILRNKKIINKFIVLFLLAGFVITSISSSFAKESQDTKTIPDFAAPLFLSELSTSRHDYAENDYVVKVGDQIEIKVWGNIEHSVITPVDGQGNIFLNVTGPIKVAGKKHSEIVNVISNSINKIYKNGIEVYAQVQNPQMISVNVLGYVNQPSKYFGGSQDSILYYLISAKGIKEGYGSYRDIRVIRNGKTVKNIDLYKMLTEGLDFKFQFHNGDTIFIPKSGIKVLAQIDDVHFSVELNEEEKTGYRLLDYLPSGKGFTHVSINNPLGKTKSYVLADEFNQYQLNDAERYEFINDKNSKDIEVSVKGSFKGQSRFVLKKGMNLKTLLNHIEVDPELANVKAISIYRKGVAKTQKKAIQDSLARLENVFMTTTSSTSEEAEIRAREAEIISNFVKRAGDVEPDGRLVVSRDGNLQDVILKDGDEIYIPAYSSEIVVSGEVYMPMALVSSEEGDINSYIGRSGGFTDNADEDKILLIKSSGEITLYSDQVIEGGDQLMVLPKPPVKNIQLASSISGVLYQIAIAAKVVLDL